MTPPTRMTGWWPLREARWPQRAWLGNTTWLDGNRMFARIAPDGPAGAPPILMVHGLVVSGTYFRPIAEYLDEHFPLYIPDLPGYGRSSATHSHTLEELTVLLDRWMDIHGLRDTIVVANSLGCQIATLLAVRYPHRVSRLVMVAPTMDPGVRGIVGVMWRGLRDIPRERQSLWRIWIPDFFAYGPLRALIGLLVSLRDPQIERMPCVRQPVIAVAGERDPICPVSWVERFASLARAGSCQVIPGAAHAMNYSVPEALGRIITEVIGNVGSDGTERLNGGV